jgi:hypothetical protein
MFKHIFFESTSKIFRKFDNYEIWPCILVNQSDPNEGYDRCDADNPDIEFWSVYGHFQKGGLECVSDHKTFVEAKKFMKTLPKMPLTPLTPF